MAKCWTCGAYVEGWQYTCTHCRTIRQMDKMQDVLHGDLTALKDGIASLESSLSDGFSQIASVLEWGFSELTWQLKQQTNVLQSIDQTLKTPSQTQANEWRIMAEELRGRGVLDKAEEFFTKALAVNPLDYRIYIGLANTYLRMNQFEKARAHFESSLPHAPNKELSCFSYRQIAHISACDENYQDAIGTLTTALALSPGSPECEAAYYESAVYNAQKGDMDACLSSLRTAILADPKYWYVAQKDGQFGSFVPQVLDLLNRLLNASEADAKERIARAEGELKKSRGAVTRAEEARNEARNTAKLDSLLLHE